MQRFDYLVSRIFITSHVKKGGLSAVSEVKIKKKAERQKINIKKKSIHQIIPNVATRIPNNLQKQQIWRTNFRGPHEKLLFWFYNLVSSQCQINRILSTFKLKTSQDKANDR